MLLHGVLQKKNMQVNVLLYYVLFLAPHTRELVSVRACVCLYKYSTLSGPFELLNKKRLFQGLSGQ